MWHSVQYSTVENSKVELGTANFLWKTLDEKTDLEERKQEHNTDTPAFTGHVYTS